MIRALRLFLACCLTVGASACSSAGAVVHMKPVASVNTAPAPSEAMVVFLRPSGWGEMTQSSVFDVTTAGPAELVGIVAAKMKVAYRTTPGRHVFMVVGENADFVDAMLAPGKLYHVVLVPGPGYKARFVAKPVHPGDRTDLPGWLAATSWVETTQDSFLWARENARSIEAKRARYWREWTERAPSERVALGPDDGQ